MFLRIFFLLVSIISVCWAQTEPYFYVKNKLNGLTSNQIYDLHFSKDGLLYIADDKGLSRYDGTVVTHFPFVSDQQAEVSNIMEAEDGNIFCKSFSNQIFKLEKDSLTKIVEFSSSLGFSPSSIHKNKLISLHNDKINFLDVKNLTSISVDIPLKINYQLISNPVFSCLILENNTHFCVWVDSNFTVYKNIITNRFVGALHLSNQNIFSIYKKKIDQIYWLNHNEIVGILPQNLAVNYISVIQKKFYVCTTEGVYIHNPNNRQDSKWLLKGYNVSDVVQSKDKSFFISTLNKGLLVIPDEKMLQMTDLQSNVSTILSSQSKVMYGLQSGDVSIQDTFQKSIQHIQLKGSKEVSFLFHDTLTQTMMVSGIHSNFIHQNQTNQENFIIKDACYYKSGVLLATNIGLLLFTSQNSVNSNFSIKSTFNHANLYSSIANEPIQKVIYHPKEDLIYYFSSKGLFQISNLFSITKLPELKNNILNIEIFDERLLIFTKNNKILTWNGKNYTPIYGDRIEKSIVLQVKIIQGKLWILTENGLIEFDGKITRKWQFYHHFDYNDFQSFAIFDKHILINTYEKVLQFPIDKSEEKLTTSLIIHEISSKKSNKLSNHSILHDSNNSIVFKFSILSFHHKQAIHLAYKINDDPLIHLNTQNRQLILNYLNPDDYNIKFFLVGDNQSRFVSEFHFTIQPPFHKTIGFYIFLVFLTSVVIYYLSKRVFERWKRTSILEQTKLMLEKELDKSLLSSIRAQMNPHFLFNALNTIQSYIYMNDKKSASIYISKFSDLTRTILNVSGKEFVSIEEEVEVLNLYLELEKMRFEDEFEFKISLSTELYPKKHMVKIPPMMIQPYVENAIKHGLLHKKDNRKLSIDFIIEHQKLVIKIEDNGVGRQRSSEINQIKQKKYPSFAIEANKKRLEILQNYYQNISFEIIDLYEGEKAAGTQVVIILPIEYSN